MKNGRQLRRKQRRGTRTLTVCATARRRLKPGRRTFSGSPWPPTPLVVPTGTAGGAGDHQPLRPLRWPLRPLRPLRWPLRPLRPLRWPLRWPLRPLRWPLRPLRPFQPLPPTPPRSRIATPRGMPPCYTERGASKCAVCTPPCTPPCNPPCTPPCTPPILFTGPTVRLKRRDRRCHH